MVSVTGSPSGPRTRDTTSSIASPSVDLPSTCGDHVAALEARRLGGRARDHRPDDRALGLVGVELDADADERARQRLVDGLRLVGGHERRVPLVADGRGQAADRAVGEVAVVEVLGVDVVVLDRLPRLARSARGRSAPAAPDAGRRPVRGGPRARPGIADGDAAREHDDGEHGRQDPDRSSASTRALRAAVLLADGAGGGRGTTGRRRGVQRPAGSLGGRRRSAMGVWVGSAWGRSSCLWA